MKIDVLTAMQPTMDAVGRPRSKGHTRPRPVDLDLSQPGWLRVGHLLTIFSISHSSLYMRLKDGRIPPADGNDGRPYWRTTTIAKVLSEDCGAIDCSVPGGKRL